MRNLVQPPPSLRCDLCNGELRLKLIETTDKVLDLDAACSSAQSAVMNSRTLYATTIIRNRMEFAGDQLFDEPPSAIMGLDLVEMTVDNSRRAASDF